MGKILKHAEGPVNVAAAGTKTFYYNHPADSVPSMVDLINLDLGTGTNAGCKLYFIDAGGKEHLFSRAELTADWPFFTYNQPFLICPGEIIKIYVYALTAADTVQWMVNGH